VLRTVTRVQRRGGLLPLESGHRHDPTRFGRAGLGIIGVVETIVYRLATRLDALAAVHMLRARGHAAERPRSPVADDGHTVHIRVNRGTAGQVRSMVERMFPDASPYPDPLNRQVSDGV
jgi:hypothetical protein